MNIGEVGRRPGEPPIGEALLVDDWTT